MVTCVSASFHDLQVVQDIVLPISVTVMDAFVGGDATSKFKLHDSDVFQNVSTTAWPRMVWQIELDVTVAVDHLTALPGGVVRTLLPKKRFLPLVTPSANRCVEVLSPTALRAGSRGDVADRPAWHQSEPTFTT